MRLFERLMSRSLLDWQAALRDRRTRVQKAWNRVKNYCLNSATLLFPMLRIDDRTLRVFYDLGREPMTFDFLIFLAAADLKRRAMGLDAVSVVIISGEKGGFREEWPDYERIIDRASRRWRIARRRFS